MNMTYLVRICGSKHKVVASYQVLPTSPSKSKAKKGMEVGKAQSQTQAYFRNPNQKREREVGKAKSQIQAYFRVFRVFRGSKKETTEHTEYTEKTYIQSNPRQAMNKIQTI